LTLELSNALKSTKKKNIIQVIIKHKVIIHCECIEEKNTKKNINSGKNKSSINLSSAHLMY
jgi:hypothetical protein